MNNDIISASCYRCNQLIDYVEYSCTCIERGTVEFINTDNRLDVGDCWDDNEHDEHDNYEFTCPSCGSGLIMRRLREHNRMTGDTAFDAIPSPREIESVLKENNIQVQ